MDVLGSFPPSRGFEHTLVVVDRFSSLVRLVPMKKQYTTRDIVDALISKVYCYHGIPHKIISNRGPQFVSNFFRELYEAFDVHLMPSTALHQQINGSAERTIKTITQTLRSYVNAKQTNWVDHHWKAEYKHNNASSEAYRTFPAEICQGQIVSLRDYKPTNSTAVDQYLENLELSHKVYHDNLVMARYKELEYAQKRRNANITLKVEDLVMYQRRSFKKNLAQKLQTIWRGPYQVTAIDKHGNLRLNIPRRYSCHPDFTQDMLKHYHNNPEHQRNIPEDEETPLYTIDRIIDHKMTKDGKKYLICWKGYDVDKDTWEPANNIEEDTPGSVEDYRDILDKLGQQMEQD